MPQNLVCWKCGAGLSDLPLPLSRRAECAACGAELHVCRLCRHYAQNVAKQCREPMAEEVKEKTRANFCEWFQPRSNAHAAEDTQADKASRAELADLFGGAPEPTPRTADAARAALDQLFGAGSGPKPGEDEKP